MEGFEEDPAAAFLAREQDELADIADDALVGATTHEGFEQPPLTIQQEGNGSSYQNQEHESYGDYFSDQLPTEDLGPQDPYGAISQMDTTSAEPECIIAWRAEQNERLAAKDSEENQALEELKIQARTELEEWYGRQEEQLGQTKGTNRDAESAFVQERDEIIPGHEWERVARLCDFSSKTSKNTKDVSRMRSIFLQLKQTPPIRA